MAQPDIDFGSRAQPAQAAIPAVYLLQQPVYTVVLYAWHLGPTFTAALRNDFVHALQHQSFIAFSALAWWPVI